ncbi:MAG TPA: UvrB/UvrC motif-containing protein [Anaerohalosphaeraceae bacterium]|nr:UvrB/UvrC motif-containing protein [Phycisphaerae bacterium]HOK95567.1 UvrB/UvrC motif-containing protein [Anaerohalosphaeraceae bacterium]HOL31980.1 UvrB/UvrC motif-containing protein [Anaerohalosphaeraceae bacterium]HOM76414.1 UvrB/UvrC motif-containing protein [Anaerohalosphaeraceae bacterium]HPC63664.1 UvrB/UvrC motif-containing protein [Anaerohalosphaeraceae bacterium]
MICQSCKEKTATIHLTEITNGHRSETHLCQDCARQQGLTIKTQIPINELLNTLLSAQSKSQSTGSVSVQSGRACPVCGMTLKRFAAEPLLGCPYDYTEFQAELLPLIEQSHNGKSRHCGKTPARTSQQDRNEIMLIQLRRQLEQAVKNEDYETAAKLRDQIKMYQ